MRGVALSAALMAGGHGLAQPSPEPTLAASIDATIAAARVPNGRFGVFVVEASTGAVVFEHDADLSLNPASNAKLLTAAAALSILGPERRFTTDLHGALRDGVVRGPIVLRGGGDPSLRAADLFDLARQLRLAGARQVDGGVVVDDAALGAEHLPPAFDQQPRETATFRAAVGAASVDENAIMVYARPGASPGAPAFVNVTPEGYLDVENSLATSDHGTAVSIDLAPASGGRERVHIAGTIAVGAPAATYRRRLDNPSLAAGFAMRSALAAAGIRVRGAVRVEAGAARGVARLARHESRPLSALLYEVGKESNNFYAETILLALAAEPAPGVAPAPVTFARGVERLVDWARRAGVRPEGLVVRNGSGLYDAERFTARQVTQILRAAWRDAATRDEYLAQLAVGGHDGTLRNRLHVRGDEPVVRAKTGTLDDVVALSGYVLDADPARALIFSVLANGVRGQAPAARELADEIVTRLVRSRAAAR